MSNTSGAPAAKAGGLSGRAIGAIVIGVLLIWWILSNRGETEVSIIVTTVSMPLWVALAIAAVLGALAGFLFGRKRYRTT